jgi:hypothetical protein
MGSVYKISESFMQQRTELENDFHSRGRQGRNCKEFHYFRCPKGNNACSASEGKSRLA